MEEPPREIIWRDTARPVRCFMFDARILTGFCIFALYMCKATLYLSISVFVVFYIIEKFGVTPPAALRYIIMYVFGAERDHASLYIMKRRARW